MSDRRMTQWEYAMMLLPYDENMTQEKITTMSRQALSAWIRHTKAIRRELLREENAELAREYKELIEEQKNKLLAVAQGMTTLTKKGRFEWKGACPLCDKGKDRFIVNTRGVPFWNCRFCIEGGDTVALVAKKNGLTMWEAAEELAGWSPRDKAEVNRQRKYKIVTPQSNKPKELADFTAKFSTCWQTFRENSLTAMAYFGKRGLEPLTINKNRVGMIQTVRGMAIAYPCERLVDGRWQVVGINRRFLDAEYIKGMIEKAETEKEKKKIRGDNPKTKLAYGGNWGIYRLRRLCGAIGLLVVEGEENSQSVWQAARAKGWPCDVASVGSQSNFKSLKADIAALASDYQHLLIWADEQHIASSALERQDHVSAVAISSPTLAGYDKPADANAMLVAGELSEFLAYQLNRLSPDLVLIRANEQALTNGPNSHLPTNGANGHLPTNGADRHLVGTPTNSHLPTNGPNSHLPTNGANGHLPTNGANDDLPTKGHLPNRANALTNGANALTNGADRHLSTNGADRHLSTNGADRHLSTNGADRHLVGTPTNGRSANGHLPTNTPTNDHLANRANTSTTAPREGGQASAENDTPEISLSRVTVSASLQTEAQASTNEHAPVRHLPTDITTLDTHLGTPTNRCAHLPTDNKERKHPETPDTSLTINKQKTDTTGSDDYLTGSDSLLAFCVELCDSINDRQKARRWYLVCEDHYIHGDYTSLGECYQAIRLATNKGTEPIFPELPPNQTNYDDLPDIDINDPFHRWVWAIRAVQVGGLPYLGEAWQWLRQIEDDELREQAWKETSELVNNSDCQLTLL